MGTRAQGNPSVYSLFINVSTFFLPCRYASNTGRNSIAQFEKLVQTRCKSKDLSVTEVLEYFNSMKQMTPMPSISALNQLFGSLSKMNHRSTVVSMYSHLARFRLVDFYPDVTTMTTIIKCLCQSGNVKLGFSVFGTMLKTGISYNTHTMGTLLDGICKEGSMVNAMALFEKIEKEEDLCNEVSYGTIISGFCKAGDSRKALELLIKMIDRGVTKPNVYCFSSVIDGLCKDMLIDNAVSLFHTMIDFGVQPNIVSYSSLIHGLCVARRPDEAKMFFMHMVGGGISPNVFNYTVIIDALCKDGKINEALIFFDDMAIRGVVPNLFCYNALLAGLTKSGKWEEVARILENMKACGVSANTVTFSSILDARFKEGSILKALHLVGVMAEKHPLFDVASGSFLSGSSGLPITEEAKILCDNMKNVDIFSDIQTLSILLNGLSSGFMILKAQKLFEVMLGRGLVNTITFTTMINAYCMLGQMTEAEYVFDQMEIKGVFPDTITYNTLAKGFLKVQRIDDARKTLKDLIMKGLRPDEGTRSIMKIIHACKHESDLNTSLLGEKQEVNKRL